MQRFSRNFNPILSQWCHLFFHSQMSVVSLLKQWPMTGPWGCKLTSRSDVPLGGDFAKSWRSCRRYLARQLWALLRKGLNDIGHGGSWDWKRSWFFSLLTPALDQPLRFPYRSAKEICETVFCCFHCMPGIQKTLHRPERRATAQPHFWALATLVTSPIVHGTSNATDYREPAVRQIKHSGFDLVVPLT